jgi:hypothetical protein
MDEILADYNELPFPLPQKHSWRSTFRFHIEHEQFREAPNAFEVRVALDDMPRSDQPTM